MKELKEAKDEVELWHKMIGVLKKEFGPIKGADAMLSAMCTNPHLLDLAIQYYNKRHLAEELRPFSGKVSKFYVKHFPEAVSKEEHDHQSEILEAIDTGNLDKARALLKEKDA